ncbi:acyltransferase family protein [Novosphingobium mathurense]|uniref:Acyltransferase 3 domain-containing protein n=1 Tax=Novosphingobium mathurense TaxID=428990 RepID=A0A1U6GSE0_9SPHN|nr:hypothetical protein SAMN06295987_101252 [Novosphingobium mathurense]
MNRAADEPGRDVGRLTRLDGLRGLAACGVAFLYHTQQLFPAGMHGDEPRLYHWIYDWGWTLVDLFFLISGYIFAHVCLGQNAGEGSEPLTRGRLADFAVARFAREGHGASGRDCRVCRYGPEPGRLVLSHGRAAEPPGDPAGMAAAQATYRRRKDQSGVISRVGGCLCRATVSSLFSGYRLGARPSDRPCRCDSRREDARCIRHTAKHERPISPICAGSGAKV